MCGIAGIFSPQGSISYEDRLSVLRMMNAQKARGPDGDGQWHDSHCVLGHRRLAILDRSQAGKQPMVNLMGSVVLSYNGEIYNYQDLRADLQHRYGFVFHSNTDTEVLLAGSCIWGMNGLVERLRGMFAFALYSYTARTLYLVRDRMGIKPMYWRRIGDGVAFASTVKALLATGWPVTENPNSLVSFIRWGSVVGNETTVNEIKMVPPATILTITADGVKESRYWRLEDFLPRDETIELTQVRALLEDTVSRHLQSDVPVGVFLSGGVDSSVLAKLSKCDGLTASFPDDQEYDELYYADEIGPTHWVPYARPVLKAFWPTFIQAMDQPSIDGFNTFLIARHAWGYKFPVALSGLGADELFAGYKHLQRSTSCPYWYYRSVFKPWQIKRMIDCDVSACGYTWVANATYAECTRYLHDQLLRDTDWASMAHGVEVRVPYLDHKLVEAILPVSMKLKCKSHKYLLIEATKDLLPREVWDRPKQGFELPFDRWLKQDADHWQAIAMENTPLKKTGVEWVWKQFRKGRLHWSRAWATVIASQWKKWNGQN